MIENLVSIITPAYNCANYIGTTIESVLSQTYSYWEMIIVDDCSSDNTEEVVLHYASKDSRIKYKKLEVNSGAAVARNVAMSMATGQYIAFLDSDDVWLPDKLLTQIQFMQENNYKFTCTDYEQIDETGRHLGKIIHCIEKADYNRVLLDCPIGNSTVMYDVTQMGKFEVPNIRKRNDDALWLKMLKSEKFIYGLNQVLVQYRVRHDSISANKFQLIKYHWVLYRKIEHLNIMRSIFYILHWGVIKILRIK
ncbi:MAG TPA: glycosyltransferase family 2 protein [Candidatus Coprenecus stercorigallinarum]|nr:glycosyltransferase group 2 family protein [Alistipes sp. CAG:831]HIR94535.1 glycosyltransferase family 2 protein [Candidatus Coprenecus stercorigallinarum]